MDVDAGTILINLQERALSFITRLPGIVLAILVFLLFIFLANHLSRWVRDFVNGHSRSKNAATVLSLVARWGIILLGVLVALSIALPTFTASDLIQVLGIGSVAIGFAFRDIFQNFLAGLIILLTDAFRIGDQIIVENEGLEGTVTDIQTRATTIATYDDRLIIIPNATLFTNAVTINTATENLRSAQTIGISYDTDIDKACALILGAINQVEGVLTDPEADVLVEDFADSTVNLKARWWTNARRSRVTQTKSKVLRQIKYTLDEHGIDIPFPIRTIYVKDQVHVKAVQENGRHPNDNNNKNTEEKSNIK
jgi:small conductance mechanosensitive channel